jgi:kinesin family protein 5
VNYRDSKLTRLLKDSLGGNFKTTLIVTCSPHSFNVEETLSSLNFAKRAKNVKNNVKVNIKRSPQELERIISNLTLNIQRLLEENKKLQSDTSKEISFSKAETKYICSKFSLDSQKVGSNNTEQILETVIKQKDEEINKLKEDIENLTNEKTDLLKEIKNLKRFINLDKNIEILEKSIKSNILLLEDLNNKKQSENDNLYKLENVKLKEMLNFNQGLSFSELEKNMENNLNVVYLLTKRISLQK